MCLFQSNAYSTKLTSYVAAARFDSQSNHYVVLDLKYSEFQNDSGMLYIAMCSLIIRTEYIAMVLYAMH